MKFAISILLLLAFFSGIAFGEPKVVVLPFDPIIDSMYTYHGKESILDYRNALQQMLVADFSKYSEIWTVEVADLERYIKSENLKPERWNDLRLAAQIAGKLGADYAIIGTYGEFSREIRVDSRVVVAASGEIPPGFTASATVSLWDDLPTAASRISEQLVPIITASGRLRPTSKGVLFPEGDIASYDPAGDSPADKARLVVWVNTPSPEILSNSGTEFVRCERIDRMNIPTEKQTKSACKYALLPAGKIELKIIQRGFLPYVETLNLAAGKVYRLEVNLKPIEQMPR